jgi:hypothetical protein
MHQHGSALKVDRRWLAGLWVATTDARPVAPAKGMPAFVMQCANAGQPGHSQGAWPPRIMGEPPGTALIWQGLCMVFGRAWLQSVAARLVLPQDSSE